MELFSFLIAFIFLINSYMCQENAGTNLAPALRECYNTTRLITRDYRLPADINVLIDIMRRIEDENSFEDARELSYQILHRFRQDGIRKKTQDIDITQGIPYSPKGKESYKNRVQLRKLTPGNARTFNNDSLTSLQACSLHFMVSSTIDFHELADDSSCPKVARYTARVQKRQTEFAETESSSKSGCPIESGVVYSKWGTIKGGIVIAGIAAGFQPNPVPVVNGTVLSSYASTIAGELSEVCLYDVEKPRNVGNKGNWNTSIDPKYYFLESPEKNHLYLTDAEIRGGLDGLFIALNIEDWKSKSSDIKISQILDLYYTRGVFNTTARACNRKELVKDIIKSDKLIEQTTLFNSLLDQEALFDYTPNRESYPSFAQLASQSLQDYFERNMDDLKCTADDLTERASTDVLIFVDTTWKYQTIQPIISYILKNIDINKYESSYTLFDGDNCDPIVNRSRSILEFYEQYNNTVHQKYPPGFDYNKVIQITELMFKKKLDNATDLTGQSTIVLMLPHNTPTSVQKDYVKDKKDEYKRFLPDIRIIVGGSGSKDSYAEIASNTDIFGISDGDEASLINTAKLISTRIKKIPRSVVNPKCGSSFSTDDTSSFELVQYVEPTLINYHKISPNYFHGGQTLKIRGQGGGTIIVCTSRKEANVNANVTDTDPDTNCTSLEDNEISTDISNYCADESATDCSPIYISVQGSSSKIRCTESNACRFPDNIKYTISLENVKCSNCGRTVVNYLLILSMFFIYSLFLNV